MGDGNRSEPPNPPPLTPLPTAVSLVAGLNPQASPDPHSSSHSCLPVGTGTTAAVLGPLANAHSLRPPADSFSSSHGCLPAGTGTTAAALRPLANAHSLQPHRPHTPTAASPENDRSHAPSGSVACPKRTVKHFGGGVSEPPTYNPIIRPAA